MVDKSICIGCRYCMVNCPYRARSFVWERRKGSGYPSEEPGVVDKCDLCFHRLDKGVVPSCVNGCPASCRTVGDLNDSNSEVSKLVADNPVQTLLPELGNEPQVYYIGLDRRAAEAAFESGVRATPVKIPS